MTHRTQVIIPQLTGFHGRHTLKRKKMRSAKRMLPSASGPFVANSRSICLIQKFDMKTLGIIMDSNKVKRRYCYCLGYNMCVKKISVEEVLDYFSNLFVAS